MTSMLTAEDRTALLDIFAEAQEDHSLILARQDGAGGYTTLAAQDVQVSYESRRQPSDSNMANVAAMLSAVTFYREAPFNVQAGDLFELDGHKGGTIRRVYPDPVLGVISAEADLDTAR